MLPNGLGPIGDALGSVGSALGPLNPFGIAGDAIGKAAAEGWTGIMLAIWSAGLWVLKLALTLMENFLTPDITENGPAGDVYRTTFWGAGALVGIMALVQLGFAVFRRDGQSMGRLLLGSAQFVGVWAAWLTYGAAVVAACGGLTKALMQSMLSIDSWAEWNPMGDYDFGKSAVEVVLATVLGFLGLFLWLAAIGHFAVMLARGAALLVLAATAPIAAAGLVSEVGRSWFWKSVRWFHAAALTPVLTVLVMGIGVKIAGSTATGAAASAEEAVATAFPSTMLILISVAAPLALFRLLSFVDPGTSSGASMRAGVAAAGGIQGLLSGKGGASDDGGGSAASSSDSNGQSQGEAQRNQATAGRFGQAFGGASSAFGQGIGMVMGAGATATSVTTDELNQSAVGDSSYYPDYQRGGQRFNPDQRDPDSGSQGPDDGGQDPASAGAPTPTVPMPTMPQPPTPGGAGGAAPGGAGAPGGGGGGAGGGGAAAAGEVPPVV